LKRTLILNGELAMANEKPIHGTFCWNELMTRDPEKAEKFYTELLGWKATDSDMPGMKYTLLKADEKDAGGMMKMPDEIPDEVPSHWMAYVTVDDVDALAEKTEKLGGKLLFGPHDVPSVGRFATIQDPTGAVISLITFPSE
jgi:predicted enzyme related to lactoylglutathione lyase